MMMMMIVIMIMMIRIKTNSTVLIQCSWLVQHRANKLFRYLLKKWRNAQVSSQL